MSRRARSAAAAALVIALAAVPAATPAGAGRGGKSPERLLVTAREYSLTLSRAKIHGGKAIVQLYDYGEDPHDLRLQRVGGSHVFELGTVLPGEVGELRLRLKRRSRYRLWCSFADHAALGMVATLRTKRR